MAAQNLAEVFAASLAACLRGEQPTEVVQYAARKRNPDLGQPSLFETSNQPHLKELGPGRWITIHSEKGEHGSHGGHAVYVGDDGKMKTGKFAGKSMAEAFGAPKPKDKRLTKRGAKHEQGQPGLFETESQPTLPGVGPGNHINVDAIGSGKSAADSSPADRSPESPEQPPEQPAAADNPHQAALDRAKPYRQHGQDYDRTAHTRASRLESAMQKGHGPAMLDHLAGELNTGIDALEQRKSARGAESKEDEPAAKPTREELRSNHSRIMQEQDANDRRKDPGRFAQEWIHNDPTVDDIHKDLMNSSGHYRSVKKLSDDEALSEPIPAEGDEFSGPVGKAEQQRQQMVAEEFARRHPERMPEFAKRHFGIKPESKPGIIEAPKTVANDKAKPGDQLSLFGEATRPTGTEPPKLKGGGETSGKAQNLFDTHGDKDQMDLFGDGVMPESMVFQPGEKSSDKKAAAAKETAEAVQDFWTKKAGQESTDKPKPKPKAAGKVDRDSDKRYQDPYSISEERRSPNGSLTDHDSALVDLQTAHDRLERAKKQKESNLKFVDAGSHTHEKITRHADEEIASAERAKVRAFNKFTPHAERLSARKAEFEGESKKKDEPAAVGAVAAKPAEASDEQHENHTPRQAAAAAQKQLDSDYEFARASSVGNVGEDLKGSARHRVNAWKGLAEAEKDGTASEFMTRKSLLKVEPHNLRATITDTNALSHLVAHSAITAFPESPGGYPAAYDKYRDRSGNPLPPPKSPEEIRKQYHSAYLAIKSKAEELAKSEIDPKKVARGIAEEARRQIKIARGLPPNAAGMATLDAKDPYNPVANGLVSLANRASGSGYKKTDFMNRAREVANLSREKYGENPTEQHLEQIKGHVLDLMEGKSLNKTFGKESAAVKRFDPSAAYVKHATRKGGRDVSSVTADPNKATKHMIDSMGLRGVQWGNSVTDDERKHHAAKSVEALTDLADVVGLHPKDIALDGKLGLAIGARGKGTASAHYEPGTQVINLTRSSGVGTLAHEWGHAFDHMLNDFNNSDRTGGGNYMSNGHYRPAEDGKNAIRDAYKEWWASSSKYRDRLRDYLQEQMRNGGMSHKKANDYWNSGHEIFARTFERDVQRKLEEGGKENTYLAGLGGDHPLWPTAEESKAMAPAFDKIFEEYRKHKHGSPDKVKFSQREAYEAFWGAAYADRLRYAGKDQMAFEWDEESRPREPAGKSSGGQFKPRKAPSGKHGGKFSANDGKRTDLRVVGTSEKVSKCGRCGRTDLRKTICVERLDANGEPTGEREYYGSDCVSKVTGRSQKAIEGQAERADYLAGLKSKEKYSATEAQREAGNYKMRKVRVQGLSISIETPKGQRRRPQWPPMPADYGYIRGTMGRDGDHVDVFIGPDRESGLVVVVDQVDQHGKFDEHKCLIGFHSESEAVETYKKAYQKGWKVGPVSCLTIKQFKAWLSDGSQKKKLSSQVSKYSAWEDRSDLSLVGDLIPFELVRYDWNSALHPRNPAGSPQGTGGEFTESKQAGNRPGGALTQKFIDSGHSPNSTRRIQDGRAPQAQPQQQPQQPAKPQSSVKRELAYVPEIARSHALHRSQLGRQTDARLLDWSARVYEAVGPMAKLPATVTDLTEEEQHEVGWGKVDKNKIRELLEEMNQMDREFRVKGIPLSDYINANGLIPERLAVRLDGGSRFFNPELLGNKIRDGHREPAQPQGQPETEQHPGGTSQPEQQPPAQPPSSPATAQPTAPAPTGLNKRAENKLDKTIKEYVGDAPNAAAHLKSVVMDAWKSLRSEAEMHNDAMRDIIGQFTKKGFGGIASAVSRGADLTKIAGFDEIVDYAEKNFPHIVANTASDSESGSSEDGLVKALQKGIQEVPQPYSEEVMDMAADMVGQSFWDALQDPYYQDDADVAASLAESDEMEEIPFSVRRDIQAAVIRYWNRAESMRSA